jgi:hypothetical protein
MEQVRRIRAIDQSEDKEKEPQKEFESLTASSELEGKLLSFTIQLVDADTKDIC